MAGEAPKTAGNSSAITRPGGCDLVRVGGTEEQPPLEGRPRLSIPSSPGRAGRTVRDGRRGTTSWRPRCLPGQVVADVNRLVRQRPPNGPFPGGRSVKITVADR